MKPPPSPRSHEESFEEDRAKISEEMKKTIAIVCGGDTSEHDVSLRSAAGIESFMDQERYISYKVEIHAGKWEAILPNGERTGESSTRILRLIELEGGWYRGAEDLYRVPQER